MIVVKPRRVEQDLILQGGAAEAGIVSDARDTAIGARNDPVIVGLQFLGRTIRALEDVAIDEAAGTKKRRHTGRHASGERCVTNALEDDLTSEIGIDAFVKCEAKVGKPVERDGAHHRQMGCAVHSQFEREGGEALDLFRGVTGPLRNEFDHGRRKIGIGIDGHALKGNGARNDDEHGDHHHQEALLKGELDNTMDHLEFSGRASPPSAAENS